MSQIFSWEFSAISTAYFKNMLRWLLSKRSLTSIMKQKMNELKWIKKRIHSNLPLVALSIASAINTNNLVIAILPTCNEIYHHVYLSLCRDMFQKSLIRFFLRSSCSKNLVNVVRKGFHA